MEEAFKIRKKGLKEQMLKDLKEQTLPPKHP